MISLAPVQEKDHALILAWASDPDMAEYFRRFPPPFVWNASALVQQITDGSFVIRDGEQAVGICSLANLDRGGKKAEFGVAIDKKLCPKRAQAATAAIELLGEYAFDYLGLNKLYCLILAHREDLIKHLTAHGFKEEGHLRDNVFFQGSFQDELLLGLLHDEYRRTH